MGGGCGLRKFVSRSQGPLELWEKVEVGEKVQSVEKGKGKGKWEREIYMAALAV
jgi:hypothetical protein